MVYYIICVMSHKSIAVVVVVMELTIITSSSGICLQYETCIISQGKKVLYWIDLLRKERKQDCAHVNRNQLDDPLPFEIPFLFLTGQSNIVYFCFK